MNKFDLTEKVKEELRRRNLWEQEEDEKEESEETENETEEIEDDSEGSNDSFCEMVCQMLHSQKQAHIFHLGTKSYAEHMALNSYYSEIDDLVDGIIESYQGKYGLLTNYKSYKNQTYKNKKQVLKYFMGLLETIEENRDSVDDSYLQNQIDTVQELIYSTLYKLKFLN
jgi:hypothetical protein